MKKQVKFLTILILIILMISTNVKALTIDETARAYIVFDNTMPYHYEAEEKVNYKMLMYNGGVLYTFNRNNDIVMTLFTDAERYMDSVCERILENGYPKKTYQDLGVNNNQEAYFATQEAIYAYLENKNMNKYIAEDEQGQRILNATKKILDIAKKEEVSFEQIDSEWKVYEVDENYMYKNYSITLDSKLENANIELEASQDVKILTQDNKTISNVKNGDIVKIVVPKGMNQNFKVKLIYEKEGPLLYKCYDSSNTSIKYLISEIGQLSKEIGYEIEFKELAQVTIKNYDNETKQIISGGVFEILDKLQNIIKQEVKTDENGIAKILLEKGEYFLKQVEVKEEYVLTNGLINFEVKDIEDIELNVYNSKVSKEEIQKESTQINVIEENKQIVENDITNVTNLHTTNIEKEIIHQTNETNVENVNNFVNTIYKKNINNIKKENTYQNKSYEEVITNNNLQGENRVTNMPRDEYSAYVDFIKMGNLQIPNLPVALKQ